MTDLVLYGFDGKFDHDRGWSAVVCVYECEIEALNSRCDLGNGWI